MTAPQAILDRGYRIFLAHDVDCVRVRTPRETLVQRRIGSVLALIQIIARKTGRHCATLDAFEPKFDKRISAREKPPARRATTRPGPLISLGL
jgi:hypothetical protein